MLRIPIKDKPRKLKGVLIGPGSGPNERIQYLKMLVTKLIRDERIEGREDRMDEARGYTEQLITLAIREGDTSRYAMSMADKWLLDKDLVHKLFKVLAPRYEKYSTSYTSVYRLPAKYPGQGLYQSVLELKGNPYPPVIPRQRDMSGLLSNILLDAASQDFWSEKEGEQKTMRGKREKKAEDKKESTVADKLSVDEFLEKVNEGKGVTDNVDLKMEATEDIKNDFRENKQDNVDKIDDVSEQLDSLKMDEKKGSSSDEGKR